MGDISKHLSRGEVACKCGCGMMAADHVTVECIEKCTEYFLSTNKKADRVALHINSWNRCVEHNETIQKQYNSRYTPYSSKTKHLLSIAADFWLEFVYSNGVREKIDDDLIADYLEDTYPGRYGIGRYAGRTHFDTREGGPARWDNR